MLSVTPRNRIENIIFNDCVDATLKLFHSDSHGPINIGSEVQVSINEMIDIIEEIANYKIERIYNTNMPVGVRGLSSNNDKIKRELSWEPTFTLRSGLEITYKWIEDMLKSKKNDYVIFTKS